MIDDLVLGAGGNLGQALCRRLLKSGRAVAGTYFTHRPDFSEVRLFQADVSSNDLGALVGKLQPKRVFHLAWSTDLDACERSEKIAFGPAREGLESLLSASARSGAHFIFMSSDGVFGDPNQERFEDSPPTPINQYGRGKVEAEGRIRSGPASWTIVRACPVGVNHREKGLLNWALRTLRAGESISGFTDSSFTPISIRTLADALAALGPEDSGKMEHFLSNPPVSKYRFLLEMATIQGFSPNAVQPGSLANAQFVAARPSRQDLQTREPARTFPFSAELRLALEG